MISAKRPLVLSAAIVAGLGTIPYLSINLWKIAAHHGNFIHFSKLEAATLTIIIALFLWLGSAAILYICALLAKEKSRLCGLIAIAAFSIVATAVEPSFWRWCVDLTNGGLAEWIFRTGVLATALGFIPRLRVTS